METKERMRMLRLVLSQLGFRVSGHEDVIGIEFDGHFYDLRPRVEAPIEDSEGEDKDN